MNEQLQSILSANRAQQRRAAELNTRAGKTLFRIFTREELVSAITVALGGARCVAEINDPTVLALPPLNEEKVLAVLALCPDTITVCGREAAVEYRVPYYGTPYPPRVKIDFRGEHAKDWLAIPNEGILLPDGREVSMYSAVDGYGYYIEAPSSQFKAKARECLNQGLWDNWRKPELPAPTDSSPPIVEMEYGRCVVTGAALIAYGTVNYDSWYESWKSRWSRDRSEIEHIHAQACVKFLEIEEKATRDALKKRIGQLYNAYYHNRELAEELRSRMYSTYYGYSGGATTVTEMEALIVEVEAAVVAIEKRKAEAERKQREAEARRGAVDEALGNIGWPEAHIWVPESGEVAYVLAGKTSKMGNFVVQPVADVNDTSYNGRPYCFGDSKYQAWVAFRFGVKSKAQDYSNKGNLQSEVSLFVPKDFLTAGVYGVGADEEGQFFFPVIYHNAEGEEMIPEVGAIRKIRAPKESKTSAFGSGRLASASALAALAAKFGR